MGSSSRARRSAATTTGSTWACAADCHSAPVLVSSEADLPNHLANEDSKTGQDIDNDGSAENAKLATQDYALSQALNVLKGLALNRTLPAASR